MHEYFKKYHSVKDSVEFFYKQNMYIKIVFRRLKEEKTRKKKRKTQNQKKESQT